MFKHAPPLNYIVDNNAKARLSNFASMSKRGARTMVLRNSSFRKTASSMNSQQSFQLTSNPSLMGDN